jgi:hypothetical protein
VYRSLVLLGFVTVSLVAGADTPPPSQPYESWNWPPSLNRKPTSGVNLGQFRLTFEKTTLVQVRATATLGMIEHRSAGAESASWLCYTILGSDVAERIWIISNWEMGGPEQAITSVTVQLVQGVKPTEDCPELPSPLQPVSLDRKVALGISDTDLEKIIGAPSHREEPWRWFNFQGKVAGKCEGGYDLENWLVTKSEQGVVTSLYAGQVTSC